MASYLSKPTEYAPYQPTVNADLYGKLLMKKESEYQAGVEKVNKTLDYAGTIPVGNEINRQYLQTKLDQMNTYLNQNLHTDWSDKSVQKLTTDMISSIGSDPIIQGAVADVASMQKHFKKLNEDEQNNGAAAQANRTYFEEKYLNPYLGSTDLKQRFNGEYTQYQDADAWADENIKKIKPEWRQIDTPAQDIYATDKKGNVITDRNGQPVVRQHAYQQMSKKTQTWEEVPEYEIKNVIELGLRNNSSIAKQLEINAYSATKNFTADIFADKMKEQRAQMINYNNRAIEYFTDIMNGSMKDVPDEMKHLSEDEIKNVAQAKINDLTRLNSSYIKYNPELDKETFRNPQWNERLRNDYYLENFIQEKLAMFGGKKKYSLTYEGDPFAKEMQIKQFQESVNTRIDQQRQFQARINFDIEKENTRQMEWAAENPGLTAASKLFSQEASTSELLKDTDESFSTIKKNTENSYNSSINSFLYDNLKNSDLINQLFTRDSNGNILVKPDANGSTLANQEKIRLYMEKFYKAVEPGNSEHKTNIDGNDVKLDNETVYRLASLGIQNNLVKNYQKINDDMDKSRKAEGKDNLDRKIEHVRNNISTIAKKNGYDANINDFTSFVNKLNKGKEFTDEFLDVLEYGMVGMVPVSSPKPYFNKNKIAAFDAKHGKGTWAKYYEMYTTPELRSITHPSDEDIEQRKEFNNNYLKSRHAVPVAQEKLLTTGKPDENKQLRNNLKRFKEVNDLLRAGKNEDMFRMFNPKDDASSTLTVKAVIDPATKDKYLLFSDNSTKNTVSVKMTDPNADSYFNDIPQSYDSPIVQMVRSNPHYSTYENNNPTWDKSIIVNKKGNYEERVGLVYNSSAKSWTMHIYKGYTSGQIKEHTTTANLELEATAKKIDNLMIENGYIQK